MSESATGDSIPDAVQRLLKSKACRSAIMFGDELSYDSCENLIRQALFGAAGHKPRFCMLQKLRGVPPCVEHNRVAAVTTSHADVSVALP